MKCYILCSSLESVLYHMEYHHADRGSIIQGGGGKKKDINK